MKCFLRTLASQEPQNMRIRSQFFLERVHTYMERGLGQGKAAFLPREWTLRSSTKAKRRVDADIDHEYVMYGYVLNQCFTNRANHDDLVITTRIAANGKA